MAIFFSVIIPNYNGENTIGQCLRSALASQYSNFELIVVDDGSNDKSVDIIKEYPCKLIQLKYHSGASRARNVGAVNSRGEVLFFTDADCLLQTDTLAITNQVMSSNNKSTVLGGTYTDIPFDPSFFSLFQSIFIRYSETKYLSDADYIATHAMAIDFHVFQDNSGFAENFLPLLEDVEFSHRLKNKGHDLVINPNIQIQHIFNFSLLSSLKNALKKSLYWTFYSMTRGDLFSDSGTASWELKINVASCFFMLVVLLAYAFVKDSYLLLIIAMTLAINCTVSRRLFLAMYRTGGGVFFFGATLYYLFIYPLAVGVGAAMGMVAYLRNKYNKKVFI